MKLANQINIFRIIFNFAVVENLVAVANLYARDSLHAMLSLSLSLPQVSTTALYLWSHRGSYSRHVASLAPRDSVGKN